MYNNNNNKKDKSIINVLWCYQWGIVYFNPRRICLTYKYDQIKLS